MFSTAPIVTSPKATEEKEEQNGSGKEETASETKPSKESQPTTEKPKQIKRHLM